MINIFALFLFFKFAPLFFIYFFCCRKAEVIRVRWMIRRGWSGHLEQEEDRDPFPIQERSFQEEPVFEAEMKLTEGTIKKVFETRLICFYKLILFLGF